MANNHIDIDLDFLDNTKSTKKDSVSHGSKNHQKSKPTKKYNWKKILIIGGCILIFIIWVNSSESSTTTTNTNDTTNKYVSVGNYTCTEYYSTQADLLLPKINEKEIDSERSSLEDRSNQLDSLKNKMDISGVDENSSQYDINQFNVLVDDYNSKLTLYKKDAESFQSKVDDYNAKIDIYNKYLEKNCNKK
ncbi:MAG: hypothetical protein WC419_07150 [Candidatus Omnitrophota bacterium]|jgi:hypothetical protein